MLQSSVPVVLSVRSCCCCFRNVSSRSVLKLLASARSAGSSRQWCGQTITVEEVTAQSFQGFDLVLASAGGSVSRQWRSDHFAGAVMVDNSSAFRMEAGVPLGSSQSQGSAGASGVIANPNCTTILLTWPLPLAARRPMRRVVSVLINPRAGRGSCDGGTENPISVVLMAVPL